MRIVERCGDKFRVWSTVSDSYYHEPMGRSDMEIVLFFWGWDQATIRERLDAAVVVERWGTMDESEEA
jgi:hypothetical protein